MTAPTEQQFLNELDKKLWTPGSEAGASSADRLRSHREARRSGSLDAALYKHAVLGLIFLMYVSDSFEMRQQEVLAKRHAQRNASPNAILEAT